MKLKICLFFALLSLNFYKSQSLNYKLIEKINNTEYIYYDTVLIDGYGFKKLEKEKIIDDGVAYSFKYFSSSTISNRLQISILKDKTLTKPMIIIIFGGNISIENFKTELLVNGYEFNGEKKLSNISFFVYEANNKIIAISKNANEYGVRQIMYIPKQ